MGGATATTTAPSCGLVQWGASLRLLSDDCGRKKSVSSVPGEGPDLLDIFHYAGEDGPTPSNRGISGERSESAACRVRLAALKRTCLAPPSFPDVSGPEGAKQLPTAIEDDQFDRRPVPVPEDEDPT